MHESLFVAPIVDDTAPADRIRRSLRRAANLLAERGHTRGRYLRHSGALCVSGALNVAITHRPFPCSRVTVGNMSWPAYLTVHATKRAFTLSVDPAHRGPGCGCTACRHIPARIIASGMYGESGRVETGHYDCAIASWNDGPCEDLTHAVAALHDVPDACIAQAIDEEIGATGWPDEDELIPAPRRGYRPGFCWTDEIVKWQETSQVISVKPTGTTKSYELAGGPTR